MKMDGYPDLCNETSSDILNFRLAFALSLSHQEIVPRILQYECCKGVQMLTFKSIITHYKKTYRDE